MTTKPDPKSLPSLCLTAEDVKHWKWIADPEGGEGFLTKSGTCRATQEEDGTWLVEAIGGSAMARGATRDEAAARYANMRGIERLVKRIEKQEKIPEQEKKRLARRRYRETMDRQAAESALRRVIKDAKQEKK